MASAEFAMRVREILLRLSYIQILLINLITISRGTEYAHRFPPSLVRSKKEKLHSITIGTTTSEL